MFEADDPSLCCAEGIRQGDAANPAIPSVASHEALDARGLKVEASERSRVSLWRWLPSTRLEIERRSLAMLPPSAYVTKDKAIDIIRRCQAAIAAAQTSVPGATNRAALLSTPAEF